MKEIVNDGFAKVVKPYMDAQDKKSREIIAPVEVSPAEAPHSVGDQIIYNGLLYDVTAPIEVEDSLETSGAGANISPADNIEAQIKATKSQIQAAAAQAAAQNKKTQKMLAPVEEDETDASRAYVIGEQLILDGILYNVIDPIAQHGIITAEGAGANIEEADDVTTQLSSLNQTLTQQANAMVNRGAKNALNNTGVDATTVEVAWTVNLDKTVTAVVSSTTAAERSFRVYSNEELPLETGTYIISGNPSASTRIVIFDVDLSTNIANTGANGEVSFTYTKGHKIFVTLYVTLSVTAQTFKFSPMIRDARIVDSTYEPYSMTNQELTPIAQAVSNRNLLDNPWFTVNQRGLSSYGAGVYTVDRWRNNGVTEVAVSDNGVSLTFPNSGYTEFQQRIEDKEAQLLDGKVLTLSVNINGTIHSTTFTYDYSQNASFGSKEVDTGVYLELRNLPTASPRCMPRLISNASGKTISNIRAMKLELGSVSTLAMEPPPNYATELLKCQRYFYRHKGAYMYGGYFHESTTFRSSVKLPTAMRAIPSISFPDGIEYNQCGIYDAQGSFIAPSAVAVDNVNNVVGIPELLINSTTPTHTQYVTGVQRFNLTLDISADL